MHRPSFFLGPSRGCSLLSRTTTAPGCCAFFPRYSVFFSSLPSSARSLTNAAVPASSSVDKVTRAPPAHAVEDLGVRLAAFSSLRALISFYAHNAPRLGLGHRLVVLARVSVLVPGVLSELRGSDALALLSDPVDLLLAELTRDLTPRELERLDTRALASALLSLARLRGTCGKLAGGLSQPRTRSISREEAQRGALLTHRCTILDKLAELCFHAASSRVRALPPRALAMTCYAGARLGLADAGFLHRASCAAFPALALEKGSPVFEEPAASSSLAGGAPPYIPPGAHKLAARRSLLCPFEPEEAEMMATALATWRRALPSCSLAASQGPAPTSSYGRSRSADVDRLVAASLTALLSVLTPYLPYLPPKTLATLAWAAAALRLRSDPTFHTALAAEVATRAMSAAGAMHDASCVQSSSAVARSTRSTDLQALLCGAEELRARFELVVGGATRGSKAPLAAVGKITPRTLITVLRAAASTVRSSDVEGGVTAPALFAPLLGGGSAFFSAMIAATRARGGSMDSTLLSSLVWSLARSRYIGPDDITSELWKDIRDAYQASPISSWSPFPVGEVLSAEVQTALASASQGVRIPCALSSQPAPPTLPAIEVSTDPLRPRNHLLPAGAEGPTQGPPLLRLSGLRTHHAATVLWATTVASVSARGLARSAVASLALPGRAAAYSLPALAQLMWAAGIQGAGIAGANENGKCWGDMHAGVPDDAVYAGFSAGWSHVVDLVRVSEAKVALGYAPHSPLFRQVADAPPGASDTVDNFHARDWDGLANDLMMPAPPGSAVARLQAQLYTSWLALSLDALTPTAGGGTHPCGTLPPSVVAALAALPMPLRVVWRAAVASVEPCVSPLQESVVTTLARLGVRCLPEAVTPEGLSVDALLCSSNGPSIAVEMNGPHHYVGGDAHVAMAASAAASRWTLDRDDYEEGMPAPRSVLVPTLKTAAKQRWLAASGFRPVSISWLDWQRAPSTEERAELFEAKGIPLAARGMAES